MLRRTPGSTRSDTLLPYTRLCRSLRGRPEKLAARVARHLAAAGELIDSDPKTAYRHTLAARARASRLAVVREACGEAAYAAGSYAEALSELRAAKRMNRSEEHTSELQSLMRITYAVFCLKKKKKQ